MLCVLVLLGRGESSEGERCGGGRGRSAGCGGGGRGRALWGFGEVDLDFQTDMGRWDLSSGIFLLGVWNIEMEEFNCVCITIGAESWGSIISPRVKLRRGARNFIT